jgi:hypothetical protein
MPRVVKRWASRAVKSGRSRSMGLYLSLSPQLSQPVETPPSGPRWVPDKVLADMRHPVARKLASGRNNGRRELICLAGPHWVRKSQRCSSSKNNRAECIFDFKDIDGGRTRARTLDPLIKRQLVTAMGVDRDGRTSSATPSTTCRASNCAGFTDKRSVERRTATSPPGSLAAARVIRGSSGGPGNNRETLTLVKELAPVCPVQLK